MFCHSSNIDFNGKSRQAPPKISLRRTSLEAFCPPRDQPFCSPLTRRYRTHDGNCNNIRKGRWGSAQSPFNRFQSPVYSDGIEELRKSTSGGQLPSARFVSLLVHGSRESDSPVTLMLAQWGQFIDHDLTSTAQPRYINFIHTLNQTIFHFNSTAIEFLSFLCSFPNPNL